MKFSLNSKSGRVGYSWSQNNVSIHIVDIVVYLDWNEKAIVKKAIVWSELNCWPPNQSCYASGCGICLTLRPRAQEDRTDRPTGPGACSALTSSIGNRSLAALCSSLLSVILCCAIKHLLLQTSLRSVLSLLACRNSHQIASLSVWARDSQRQSWQIRGSRKSCCQVLKL